MNWPLIVNPEAEADLADAQAWYDGQRAGLGDVLLDRVQETFARLQRTPELYGKIFQDLRLGRVSRFPFNVVYLPVILSPTAEACVWLCHLGFPEPTNRACQLE